MARLDPWINEFKEIVDISLGLFKGDFESGSRIAVVLLDNCVEFMFKAFLRVKERVVGPGKRYPIKPNQWESETSRRFDKLADAMRKFSKLPPDLIDEAEHYHSIRNELYHTATPVTVTSAIYKEQLKIVISILEKLYSVKYKPKMAKFDVPVASEINPEETLNSIVKQVPGNSKALVLSLQPKTAFAQVIRLVLYGYQKIIGSFATVSNIIDTLVLNMIQVDEKKIRATLAELKQRKQVKEEDGKFILSDFGYKAMTDIF